MNEGNGRGNILQGYLEIVARAFNTEYVTSPRVRPNNQGRKIFGELPKTWRKAQKLGNGLEFGIGSGAGYSERMGIDLPLNAPVKPRNSRATQNPPISGVFSRSGRSTGNPGDSWGAVGGLRGRYCDSKKAQASP